MKCTQCGSEHLEEGNLNANGRVAFYLDRKKAKFFSLSTSDIEVRAKMCSDCGHIHLFGDSAKFNKLIKKG